MPVDYLNLDDVIPSSVLLEMRHVASGVQGSSESDKANNVASLASRAFKLVVENHGLWATILDPKFGVLATMHHTVTQDASLQVTIINCAKSKNWRPFFELDIFHWKTAHVTIGHTLPYIPTSAIELVQQSTPFLDAGDKHLQEKDCKSVFATVITQSSGYGKTMMMIQSAQRRLTVLLRLNTYPDKKILYFLLSDSEFDNESYQQAKNVGLLWALFKVSHQEMAKYIKDNLNHSAPETLISEQWYNYLEQEDIREAFISSILADAGSNFKEICQALDTLRSKTVAASFEVIKVYKRHMIKAAEELCNVGQDFNWFQPQNTRVRTLVVLDDADLLHRASKRASGGINPFNRLMYILRQFMRGGKPLPMAFALIATNSNFALFSEASDERLLWLSHVEKLVAPGTMITPYWELPIDLAVDRKQELSMWDACRYENASQRGRILYHNLFAVDSNPQTRGLRLHKIVMGMLDKDGSQTDEDSQMKALTLRIHFLQHGRKALEKQNEFVESGYRSVRNISPDRKQMESEYISEPVLANAATTLLNDAYPGGIGQAIPEILDKAFDVLEYHLIHAGHRGELISRALLILAHDMAVLEKRPRTPRVLRNQKPPIFDPSVHLEFQQPIALLQFLEHLLSPEVFKDVCAATPMRYFPDQKETKQFKNVFKDCWVNFSHFHQLHSLRSFNFRTAAAMLKRGAAMKGDQQLREVDIGIPFFMMQGKKTPNDDEPSGPITEKNTNILLISVKNKVGKSNDSVDPDCILATQPGEKVPWPYKDVLHVNTVAVTHNTRNALPEADRYEITLYGCNSRTYRHLPENGGIYQKLLLDRNPKRKMEASYPRRNVPSCKALFDAWLEPCVPIESSDD